MLGRLKVIHLSGFLTFSLQPLYLAACSKIFFSCYQLCLCLYDLGNEAGSSPKVNIKVSNSHLADDKNCLLLYAFSIPSEK